MIRQEDQINSLYDDNKLKSTQISQLNLELKEVRADYDLLTQIKSEMALEVRALRVTLA